MEYSQGERHSFLIRTFKGSNPFTPKMLKAPLEQFQILSLLSIKFFKLDFSITNFFLINILIITSFLSFIVLNSSRNNYMQETSFYFAPNSWQKITESLSELTAQLISDIITKDNEKYLSINGTQFK